MLLVYSKSLSIITAEKICLLTRYALQTIETKNNSHYSTNSIRQFFRSYMKYQPNESSGTLQLEIFF